MGPAPYRIDLCNINNGIEPMNWLVTHNCRVQMRFVRYILQVLLLLIGGSSLLVIASSSPFELAPFAFCAAFFGFPFFMTMLLREHTENRIVRGREVNQRVVGVFLLLVGIGICWLSVSIVNGYTGSATRRGDLLRVAIEVLGPWPPAAFFLSTGLVVLRIALRALRKS